MNSRLRSSVCHATYVAAGMANARAQGHHSLLFGPVRELGDEGCALFLSEPRFEGLPGIFEGPGVEGKAPAKADVDKAFELRERGLAVRRR